MAANVLAVLIPNAVDQQLFGMLHLPAHNRNPGAAILLLSPGIKGRVAPHRLYVKLARRLCDAGFMVLRFDFYGLGDAQGEINEELVANVYESVSLGRYVDDTVAAMDWLQREYRIEKFVLSGLCGGAITGLFTGAKDPRVDSLVGLAIPVIQYGNNTMRYQYLSAGEQDHFRRGYLRKLLDWRSWLRLLTLRSDFSVIAKVFMARRKPASQSKPTAIPQSVDIVTTPDASNLNSYFPPAFFSMLNRSKKVFLIFGETDRLYWDFDEKFYQRYKSDIDRYAPYLKLHIVKDARHIFEERAHQEDLFSAIVAWVEAEYGSGPTSVVVSSVE